MNTFKHIAALVVLLLFVLPVEAGDGKALYVHRNDGDFNAFFFSEIDSIVYSKLDVDSVLWDDYVTQEIWTPDTVVRIPLSVIDDISLETPSNIYKEGVVVLDEEKQGYISKCDSLTLYYSLSTPKNQLPHVGEKLVTTDMNELFPIGFLGIVKSIKQGSDYVTVECDQINIEDAFDRYYCVVEGESEYLHSDAVQARKSNGGWKTVSLPPIIAKDKMDFNLNWETSENCKLGGGYSAEYSILYHPKMHYIHIDEYGEVFTSMRIDYIATSSFKTSLFGKFSVEKEDGVEVKTPIPSVPFIEYYVIGGPRFEFSGDVAIDYERSDTYILPYFYTRGTNPNVKYRNGFGKLTHKDGESKAKTIAGEIKLYGRLFAEVGFRFPVKSWGNVYARVDAGLELDIRADLCKSIDDAPYSTKLYDQAISNDLFSVSLFKVFGSSAGAKAKWGRLSGGVKLESMLKEPILSFKLFPSFEKVKYVNSNEGKSYLSCNCEMDLRDFIPGGTPIGFKVFDENRNEIFCEYSKDVYIGGGVSQTYEIPYTHDKVNSKCTAYPVFKLFGKYEILASPSIELNNEIKPVTNRASVTKNSANVSGSLEGDIKTMTQQYEVGFFYSTTYTPQKTGKKIKATLSGNGSFNANITNLEGGVTYYYCAYLLVDDKYYYGETRQFNTTKETFLEARTGEPISIENWQAVVSGYAQSDDMNNCEFGVFYNFSGSDRDSWYIAKGENWQDGNFTATLHFFNIDDEVIYYMAYINRGDDYKFGEIKKLEKKILRSCPDDHHPHMIDLGLPSGTKWACCNVGASSPEMSGGYYAWGETQEKEQYILYENRKLDFDIAGTIYDAAHIHWGNGWRTPTPEQSEELINCTTKTWTKRDGVNGCEFTGFNGGTIFLPAAGYREKDYFSQKGYEGAYLMSNYVKFEYGGDQSWGFELEYGELNVFYVSVINNYSSYNKGRGFTVRPVCK